MNKGITLILVGLLLLGLMGTAVWAAATPIDLTTPDTTQGTVLMATVREQCKIDVPANVTFTVNDIGVSTAAPVASVTINHIVLATATKQLKLSIAANFADFTPSVSGATTWAATDVSWNAATWAAGTGAANTLAFGSYNQVATSTADSSVCSTTDLVFTLAAKDTVKRSGNHTLMTTWKVESIGA